MIHDPYRSTLIHLRLRSKYEGQWEYDRQHGYGVEVWVDGARYEGKCAQFGHRIFSQSPEKDNHMTIMINHDQSELCNFYEIPFPFASWSHVRTWRELPRCVRWAIFCRYTAGKKHGKGFFTWADGSSYDGEDSDTPPKLGFGTDELIWIDIRIAIYLHHWG